MKNTILKIENISKQYRLGLVGTGTLSHDLNRFWYKIRGKDDPYLKVGALNKRNIKATEDYVWAIQDINIDVFQGEVLGIIGKNGAGKSTLLKILSRVTSPTTGSIKTKGRIASLLEVGTGFHPELTGKENIYLNGAILGMTKTEIKSKIEEIVSFSGCEMYIDTPVKRYSSGMRVRLAFAVAAHLEPDILVIDEVLAVGDAEFQKKAIGKMQAISQGEGRTVLFVSHNMESVQKLCTRAIILENGKIAFNGEVDKAISFYLRNNNIEKSSIIKFPLSVDNAKLLSFDILDEFNNSIVNLILGKSYALKIGLKNDKNPKKLIARFQIFDRNDNLISTLNSKNTDNLYYLKPNESISAYCNLKKLSIAPGDYTLGIKLTNLLDHKTLYREDNFFNFTIVNGDYYGTGRLPGLSHLGKVMTDYSWEINPEDNKTDS